MLVPTFANRCSASSETYAGLIFSPSRILLPAPPPPFRRCMPRVAPVKERRWPLFVVGATAKEYRDSRAHEITHVNDNYRVQARWKDQLVMPRGERYV